MKFFIISLLSAVSAVHEPILYNECLPCTGYGYKYCADDPNLVNLAGNKCYTSDSDKEANCPDFDWYDNPA